MLVCDDPEETLTGDRIPEAIQAAEAQEQTETPQARGLLLATSSTKPEQVPSCRQAGSSHRRGGGPRDQASSFSRIWRSMSSRWAS